MFVAGHLEGDKSKMFHRICVSNCGDQAETAEEAALLILGVSLVA